MTNLLIRWLPLLCLITATGARAATVDLTGIPRADAKEHGKRLHGFVAAKGETLAFAATGPGAVLVRAFGSGGDDRLVITVERDGKARSINPRAVAPGGGSFEGAALSRPALVELSIPTGTHAYRVTFSEKAFVQIGPARGRHAAWRAAAEEPLATLEPASLVAVPVVTAPPAPAAAPDSLPPPVALASTDPVAVATVAPAPPAAPGASSFILTPVVGMGFVVEDALGQSAPQFVFGADGRYFLSRKPNGEMALDLVLRDHAASQVYLTDRPDLATGGAASLSTNEQMLQTDLDFAYDFHPIQRLFLGLFAGPGFRFFMNDVIPANVGGLFPGGEARFAITDSLEARARVSYLYNLFFQNAGSLSALGPPHAAANASAGLALKVGGGNRLRLEYEGEDDAFLHSYRYYHSLCFLLDLAI